MKGRSWQTVFRRMVIVFEDMVKLVAITLLLREVEEFYFVEL